MSNVAVVNLIAWQNSLFSELITWVDQNGAPIVFTGSTFSMGVATAPGLTPVLTLTTANSGILSTDLANGKYTITFAKGAIAVGNYYYDLMQVTGGVPSIIQSGTLIVNQGVTP